MLRSVMIMTTLIALLITALSACAGGSRGTGVRYNRSVEPTNLTDDEDKDDEKRNSPWHRR